MFHSQFKQDEFLETHVFCGYRRGVFVDVGASDGVTINNTLFFEKEREWTGINIEPLGHLFDELVKNRPNCMNLPYVVANDTKEHLFIANQGYTEGLSGLLESYDPRHHQRLHHELQTMGGTSYVVTVRTYPLHQLLEKYKITHIHYLSIDVEGGEWNVIQSIDFHQCYIDVIGFENNYKEQSEPIVEYLKEKGYLRIGDYLQGDIFMIHQDSLFKQNVTDRDNRD
jgi:FkbM family methyltransferase